MTKKRSFLLKTNILTLQQNKPTHLRIFYNKTNILTLKHVNQGQQCWLDKTTSSHDAHFSTRPPQDTQVFTPARQTNNKYNRTYAEVVATPYQRQFVKYNQQTTKQFRQEQDDSFNCKQQTQQLNTRQTSKPQNTDPEFGENVRIMYKAITMLHHLNNTTIEPPTITRLVNYL